MKNKLRQFLLQLTRSLFGWPRSPMTAEEKHLVIGSFATPDSSLVETGTYLGDTLVALHEKFRILASIELSPELYQTACQRFGADTKVRLYCGDSSVLMPEVLEKLEGRIVYWLDGHCSGGKTAIGVKDCPILLELEAILRRGNKDDVILIDDARLFGWRESYPSIPKLRKFLKTSWPSHHFEIINDIICIREG